VPNNDSSTEATLEKVCTAIKLVYASIFSDSAKIYFNSIHHKVEEEKMAIVLQELVGNQYGNYYYPHISGTAQSYNYYPVANMKPEEGFAVAAVGLGFYVVGGNKSYRFSPKYPRVEIYSTKDLMNSSQIDFLAVDLSKNNIDYLKDGEMASVASLDISIAETHGTLNHCASVYNPDNDRIEAGLNKYGPRIINFADILKFNYTPLAQTIDIMLNTIAEALGSPIEIEYAVDLTLDKNNLASFYLLQIKPLIGKQLSDDIDLSHIVKENTILFTKSSLGNGDIENIRDVIFIDTHKFDKMKTLEMVREIEHLNNKMIQQNKKYILIGPGRWGTRDQFLGIPVIWSQISNAKVIIEISLENFPLDTSLGSHFFHNITSMNIGYCSVINTSDTDYIRWDILNNQEVIDQTTYFRHIRFEKPLKILMNGKEKTSAITL
jgi:phosphoenolpyruvate synthase/pyruvate phosphate dikinase